MRLEFVVLTKTKRPAIETHTVTWDEGRLGRTKQVFERVWRAIEQRHFFPAPSPIACGFCPFRAPYGAWRG